MTARDDRPSERKGRWVRPAKAGEPSSPHGNSSIVDIGDEVFSRARARVAELVELERVLEDRIRDRWNEVETQLRADRADFELERESKTRQLEERAEREERRARETGQARGYEDGLGRGREEGFQAGHSEGREAGYSEGLVDGRQEGERKLRDETSQAVEILRRTAAEFARERAEFVEEARRELAKLGVEIGRALVKREVRDVGDPALRNIERAVETIFRRGEIVVELHPEDTPFVEQALAEGPSWADDLDAIELRSSEDIERGGCRLLAGEGIVDLDIGTQTRLIEEAILGTTEHGVRRQEGSR